MPQHDLDARAIARKYHKESQKKPSFSRMKRHFGKVKTPTVFQMEVSECGAASLAMILQHYGKYVPLEELRVETGVSRNGCNARNICLAGEHYGFKVTASKRELDKVLMKNHAPCMIHWNFSHFVVFEGVVGRKYRINDPQMGRRLLSREEMEESYSGTVLQFDPGENFKRSKGRRDLFTFAKSRLKGQYTTLIALLLLGIALIAPGVLNPVFSQVFLDDILTLGQNTWMKWLLLAMILTALFDAYFTYIQSNISLMLQTKMNLVSTDGMIGHLFRLPLEFFEQRYAGDLVSRVYNNVSVVNFLSGQLTGLIISIVTSLIYLDIMFCYSPTLALVGIGFSVTSVVIASLASMKITDMTRKFGMDSGKLAGAFYNGLSASASLKAVGAEGEYTARILGYYAEVTANDQKMGRLQAGLDVVPKAISSLNNVILLVLGSKYVISGELTAGMLLSFSGFLGSFSSPFSNIVGFVRSLQQLKNDLARVEDIMSYPEDKSYTSQKDESLEGRKLSGDIEVQGISFAYGKLDEPLIKNFSLSATPGRSIALVGTSGCGKSTIAKLLSGLYHPWSGNISYDGVSIDEIPSSVISSSIAVVNQTISLFEGSVYDNISAWNQEISQEEIIRAAQDACIHDDIALKKGVYEYILKEDGANLSGGQRQRIEIAKALAINPSVLILDEATSALDTSTEEKILNNIRKRNCTLIVVAQRLSTIRDCDEIIVMDRGRIKERGDHESLMAKKGMYYKLVGESE